MLYFYLFLCTIISISVADPWIPIDWRTISIPDNVQIRYLVAPLLEEKYGNFLASMNAYHAAIAFDSPDVSITLNYDALDFVHSSLFPDIIDNGDGVDLKWRNGGAVFIYNGIYTPYWTTYNEQIGVIKSKDLKIFLSTWNAQINDTNPYYNMFGVADSHNGTSLLDGWTCFDYVWEAVHTLQALGGNFTVSQLKRNYANFYALSSPVNITTQYFTNQQVHNEVVDFFKLLTMNGANMTCWEFVEAIVRALDGNFYMRRSTDYFQTKLHYPYFRLSWENVKL